MAPLEIREYNPQLPSSGCLMLSWVPSADPDAEGLPIIGTDDRKAQPLGGIGGLFLSI